MSGSGMRMGAAVVAHLGLVVIERAAGIWSTLTLPQWLLQLLLAAPDGPSRTYLHAQAPAFGQRCQATRQHCVNDCRTITVSKQIEVSTEASKTVVRPAASFNRTLILVH